MYLTHYDPAPPTTSPFLHPLRHRQTVVHRLGRIKSLLGRGLITFSGPFLFGYNWLCYCRLVEPDAWGRSLLVGLAPALGSVLCSQPRLPYTNRTLHRTKRSVGYRPSSHPVGTLLYARL